MIQFSGKRVLFFAPDFFGYDLEIKRNLEMKGAMVDLYEEKPSSVFFVKVIIRLNNRLLSGYIKRYFLSIIEHNGNKDYDYIFFIKGETLTVQILKKLKKCFPNAKTILYLWDSISNYKNITGTFHLFDRILTFDFNDAKNDSSLVFRPLFYLNDYAATSQEGYNSSDHENDLLFIGTVHSDRWMLLKKLREEALRNNLRVHYYLFVQSPIIFLTRKLFDRRFRSFTFKEVHFRPLPNNKAVELTRKSRAVIDIQHPKQTGLTMRTIEVLGSGRKLLTTNKSITDYDFYTPENVMVIDRLNPGISKEFLDAKYLAVDNEIYKKYSIDGWLSDVFLI